jgi:hypothetical protein
METIMEVHYKTKSRTPILYSDTTPGIYLKECAPGYDRAMCIPVFIAASTIHNNQALEAAKMPHK